MAGEKLTLKYVPLEQARLWDDNPKLHDIEAIQQSIRRYGFLDPPRFDATLGALTEGNGRTEALGQMEAAGEELPRGVARDKAGRWAMPVLFGVDATSTAEATAYAIDHNNLTAVGGGLSPDEVLRMWDPERFRRLFETLDADPVSLSSEELTTAMSIVGDDHEDPLPSSDDDDPEPPGENDFEYQEQYAVVVECANAEEQQQVFEDLTSRGLKCKVVAV